MAEAVLDIVLGKLADVIVNEAQLLGGIGKKVERVQRELTRIKCCLKDADSKCKGDARVQNWLNELRDVAFHNSTVVYRELKYPIDKLIHLKYLKLRGCKIDLSSFSFHRMKRLETLDVRGSNVGGECGDFWTIVTLMHVLVDYRVYLNPPISIATLSNLRTLKWVTVKGAVDWKLPNLRKLGIINEYDEWVSITNLLQTLPFLVSLGICTYDHTLPMEIVYPKALPNYQNLQSLHLYGEWPENVNVEVALPKALDWSFLNDNPMPELGKLNSLKKLFLGRHVLTEDWEGPIIYPEGFPALQYLSVDDMEMKDLTVAQGVMPKLTYLGVHSNCEVHLPPELQLKDMVINIIDLVKW